MNYNYRRNENDTLMGRIQSVAYYSYLLSPDVRVNYAPISLVSLLRQVSENKKIACILPSAEAMVEADPELISRAFEEILVNASSYSDADSEPRSEIFMDEKNAHVTISNPGHLPSPLPQFFEPWARGDQARTEGGSGLGLPIVYQIMELHRGSVSIKEEDGIVYVMLTLPVKA